MEVRSGAHIPEWRVERVPLESMKTVGALLRDPNPIHWDTRVVRSLGLGDAPVNQGPSNMAYVMNMLIAWVGDARLIHSLDVRFGSNVFAGDTVVAKGRVVSVSGNMPRVADCEVWLERAEERVLTGRATLTVPDDLPEAR